MANLRVVDGVVERISSTRMGLTENNKLKVIFYYRLARIQSGVLGKDN